MICSICCSLLLLPFHSRFNVQMTFIHLELSYDLSLKFTCCALAQFLSKQVLLNPLMRYFYFFPLLRGSETIMHSSHDSYILVICIIDRFSSACIWNVWTHFMSWKLLFFLSVLSTFNLKLNISKINAHHTVICCCCRGRYEIISAELNILSCYKSYNQQRLLCQCGKCDMHLIDIVWTFLFQ